MGAFISVVQGVHQLDPEVDPRAVGFRGGLGIDLIQDDAGQFAAEDVLARLPFEGSDVVVDVDEIAALVAWLVSEECGFSTGAVFDISGGRSTY